MRKIIGALCLVVHISTYIVLVASLSAHVATWSSAVAQIAFFAVAGLIWVMPLRPLIAWMHRR